MKQRLIDATPIENKLTKWAEELSRDFDDRDELNGVYSCLSEIQSAPTIDPESLRPHGKWVKDQFSYQYLCTNCKMTLPEWLGVFNYCPGCGAKMEDNTYETSD